MLLQPFVAGIARMSYARFWVYNAIGGAGWVLSMTLAGYFLGRVPFVANHFELVVLTIVFISVLPVMIAAWRAWRSDHAASNDQTATVKERDGVA